MASPHSIPMVAQVLGGRRMRSIVLSGRKHPSESYQTLACLADVRCRSATISLIEPDIYQLQTSGSQKVTLAEAIKRFLNKSSSRRI